jgi:transcriptional repressor NrdR
VHCPNPTCDENDTKVIDSRLSEEGSAVRRRRRCPTCHHRFTTYERVEEVPLVVTKRSGGREPFDRNKIVAGLLQAAKGRPVSVDELESLAEDVEDQLRLSGPEVSSAQVGLAVLDALRSVDEVAYVRFASVYKNFDAAADFERELTMLAKDTPAKGFRG